MELRDDQVQAIQDDRRGEGNAEVAAGFGSTCWSTSGYASVGGVQRGKAKRQNLDDTCDRGRDADWRRIRP